LQGGVINRSTPVARAVGIASRLAHGGKGYPHSFL